MADHLGPLPPYVQLLEFLPRHEHDLLIEWAIANPQRFEPAGLTKGRRDSEERIDPEKRIALVAGVRGELKQMLRARFEAALPAVMKGTGTSGTAPTSIELQMAAHPDGAHFTPHLDIPIGPNRRTLGAADGDDRIISAVYYFYRKPKAFTGGELRLYRFGAPHDQPQADPANYVDIEPVQNSVVAFPSWVTHEVRPVHCPSGAFRDYRFAVNCWYCRPLAGAKS